jgi:SAM-dependent methyltransferase
VAVAPFLIGARVLDLGAREGYVAEVLQKRTGVWTCAVDVGPFRRACRPYVTYDSIRLPFGDAAFDTTLVLQVLHHCSKPETVLDEALRVTRCRLIVMESVYRTRGERFWTLRQLDGAQRLRQGVGVAWHGWLRSAFLRRCPRGMRSQIARCDEAS